MRSRDIWRTWSMASLAYGLLASLVFLVGCDRTSAPAPAPVVTPPPRPVAALEESRPHAAGKKAFNANKCAQCHTVSAAGGPAGGPALKQPVPGGPGGPGGPGAPGFGGPPGGPAGPGGIGGRGPNLSKVGSDPADTADGLMGHIRN